MHSIKTRLSSTILFIVLLTIVIISVLSNYFINREFTNYISRQQELKTQIITTSISEQYSQDTKEWNLEYIHAVGMSSLYEGYILKVYGQNGEVLWDAQSHDMNLCHQIMAEISERMRIQYPQLNGEFTSVSHDLEQDGAKVGTVSISYFGPFFLNENEFQFLRSLNMVLFIVGAFALILSLLIGQMLAKRISHPVMKTVEVTKQIADGNYAVRLDEESDTKELKLLETSINHLAESLETLERLRKQLTEDVAHELRTPITILQSYLEAMQEGIWEPNNERLQSCYDEVVRIGRLVGDLENLARLEGQNLKLDKQRVNLYELIQQVCNSFEAEIMNKNLQIEIIGSHPELMADESRLKQVVVNLLSNAIKYSKGSKASEASQSLNEQGPSGKKQNVMDQGYITFELLETRETAGFRIRDTGIGIPEEELPYVFERFYRADKSRNRLTGGSGIGLTIVRSIILAHGGEILVQSRINEGSTFTVLLPKEDKSNMAGM